MSFKENSFINIDYQGNNLLLNLIGQKGCYVIIEDPVWDNLNASSSIYVGKGNFVDRFNSHHKQKGFFDPNSKWYAIFYQEDDDDRMSVLEAILIYFWKEVAPDKTYFYNLPKKWRLRQNTIKNKRVDGKTLFGELITREGRKVKASLGSKKKNFAYYEIDFNLSVPVLYKENEMSKKYMRVTYCLRYNTNLKKKQYFIDCDPPLLGEE